MLVGGNKMKHLQIGPEIPLGKFTFYSDGSTRGAVFDIYPIDLRRDGVQEFVVGGFETQPNTPKEYSNTSLLVFGWDGAAAKNLTANYFAPGVNKIEAAGELAFGDFNGDGLVDIFASADADMDYAINAYQFDGGISAFTKTSLGLATWQHGICVADINKDGFDDVLVAGYGYSFPVSGSLLYSPGIYLGSKAGLIPQKNSFIAGSSIAVGDFLGDGTVSAVVVDMGSSTNDTGLFIIRKNNYDGNLELRLSSYLPRPRLEAAKYGLTSDPAGQSHDVRVRALDFNNDGKLDVIVFSRLDFRNGVWPEVTSIQFLKNEGGGSFRDVTDSVLSGFSEDTAVPYSPTFGDFDGNGLTDIFVSGGGYTSNYDSTAILLQDFPGHFVEAYRAKLSDAVKYDGGLANIVLGPDGYYLVKVIPVTGGNYAFLQKLTFSDGPPSVLGQEGPDKLLGSADDEWIRGLTGNDTLTGLAGDDTLDGGAGNDSMVGGLGDDTYYVDSTGDKVVEFANQGTDTVVSDISLSLAKVANVENWVGIGSADIAATGNALGNALTGNSGANTIDGGLGIDTLTGGVGVDTFVFSSKLGATNTDTITDFVSGTDKIQLSKSVFSKFKAGAVPQANFVSGGANTKALDSNDYLIFNGSQLLYDADGSGKGVAVVVANIVGTVLASDLVVV